MVTQSAEFLQIEAQSFLDRGDYQVIASAIGTLADDAAALIAGEPIQVTGGYVPQAVYTGATSQWLGAYDSANDRWALTQVALSFTLASGGAPYQFNCLSLWQGRGTTTANKPITHVNISTDTLANTIVCAGHGLASADRVVIATTGVLPGGLSIQRYYAEVVDANTIRLHTTSALNAAVPITDTGSGSHRLCYANGRHVFPQTIGLTTIQAGQTKYFTLDFTREYD